MTRDAKKTAAIAERKAASASGLPIEAVVTANDLPDWDAERDLGYPGQFPFTRGVYPTMYRGRLWTTRQYAGFGSAVESNQRYRYLLAQGVKGLSVAFDLPTQIGMDSDHPLALGEDSDGMGGEDRRTVLIASSQNFFIKRGARRGRR